MALDLNQFASLFEIGFALHIAVAFLERIYARELPVRIDRIAARVKALERFKREVLEGTVRREETGEGFDVQFDHRRIENPIWLERNDGLLDKLYALGHDANRRLGGLKRVLGVITFLSVVVVIYSILMLFLIGMQVEMVQGLSPLSASMIVLAQLLPLPTAAGIFYLVARRMSREVDRKMRGIGELRVLLGSAGSSEPAGYVSIEELYRRSLGRDGLLHENR
ncbi:MAG: hypothetical protein AAGE01_07005 [Pseudomonadota bacterium]